MSKCYDVEFPGVLGELSDEEIEDFVSPDETPSVPVETTLAPCCNEYVISVQLHGVTKADAINLARAYAALAHHQVPGAQVDIKAAHVKADLW